MSERPCGRETARKAKQGERREEGVGSEARETNRRKKIDKKCNGIEEL